MADENEGRINKSSLNKAFDTLLKEDKTLTEQKVSRFLPVLGFGVELLFEIIGIFVVYFAVNFLAPVIVGDGFNNNFLYSMVFLPVVASLKKLPEIFKSVFVRIAVSNDVVVCKRGFFRRFIDKLYIKHIDNIEIRTTLWGEWFNYGTISLYSFGGKINLPFVKNPCVVYALLREKMNKREGF